MNVRIATMALVLALASACGDDDRLGNLTLMITPGPVVRLTELGDTVRLTVTGEDPTGAVFTGFSVSWSTSNPDVATVRNGLVTAVGDGAATIRAETSASAAEVTVLVTPDEGSNGARFEEVGFGFLPDRSTSDLWVFGDHVYTGTHVHQGCGGAGDQCGHFVVTWDVSDPTDPTVVHMLEIDANVVNDVKVSADGAFAVATHEISADGLNGITLLDLTDPAEPSIITRYTENLETGVHNVWIERIDGRDYVFAATDGNNPAAGLKVIDVTDRAAPVQVAHYYGGSSNVHDVYVRDGLAFVAHWDAGLVILDVGNGLRGGSPENPIEVSRLITRGGNSHNAWYWPERELVFVGQEELPATNEPVDSIGVVHVVDVVDIAQPVEIATVFAADATAHNFWVDEDQGILFVGWNAAGLRAVDVNGELSGRLEEQGRVLAFTRPRGPNGEGRIWAPQLHEGLVYASDFDHGIWIYRFVLDP